MSKTKIFRNTAIVLAVAGPMTAAMATNGYFSHGYGMKAKGMGGATHDDRQSNLGISHLAGNVAKGSQSLERYLRLPLEKRRANCRS